MYSNTEHEIWFLHLISAGANNIIYSYKNAMKIS